MHVCECMWMNSCMNACRETLLMFERKILMVFGVVKLDQWLKLVSFEHVIAHTYESYIENTKLQ